MKTITKRILLCVVGIFLVLAVIGFAADIVQNGVPSFMSLVGFIVVMVIAGGLWFKDFFPSRSKTKEDTENKPRGKG